MSVPKERYYSLSDTTVLRITHDEDGDYASDLICLSTHRVIASMKFGTLTLLIERMDEDNWFDGTSATTMFLICNDFVKHID